jgi:hypothetical protein
MTQNGPPPERPEMFRLVPPLSAPSQLNGLLLIYLKCFLLAHSQRQGVKSLDEKPTQDKDAATTKLSQLTEFRQLIEVYANDLREIIKKLRGRLN